jgi:hypothetical protein
MSSLSSGSPFFQSHEVISRSSFDPPPWNCVPRPRVRQDAAEVVRVRAGIGTAAVHCSPVVGQVCEVRILSIPVELVAPEIVHRLAGTTNIPGAGWGSASRHRPRSASSQWFAASVVGRCQDSECPSDVENPVKRPTWIEAEVLVLCGNRARSSDESMRNGNPHEIPPTSAGVGATRAGWMCCNATRNGLRPRLAWGAGRCKAKGVSLSIAAG